MAPTSEEDLIAELQALEKELADASVAPKVLALQTAIATKKAELDKQREREGHLQIAHQAVADRATLETLERDKDASWALVMALRLEQTEVQKRLANAEFDFGQCLRARGEFLRKQG